MPTRSRSVPLSAVLGIALAGCADDTGTYCRYDYQCVSNSCTWFSCDAPLVSAIVRAGKKHDDEEQEPTKPAPSPARETPPDCPWLCGVLTSEYQCNEAAGCHVEWECARPPLCVSPDCLTVSCGAMDADHCQAPCVRQVRCIGKREC